MIDFRSLRLFEARIRRGDDANGRERGPCDDPQHEGRILHTEDNSTSIHANIEVCADRKMMLMMMIETLMNACNEQSKTGIQQDLGYWILAWIVLSLETPVMGMTTKA